nr:glycerate kinase [Protaetiibacter intestinalis]
MGAAHRHRPRGAGLGRGGRHRIRPARLGCAARARRRVHRRRGGLDEALRDAALVITGEGSYDAQSAAGKAPALVLARARAAGVPAAIVAGRVDAEPPGTPAISLSALAGGTDAAIADPSRWLRRAGAELATRLSPAD